MERVSMQEDAITRRDAAEHDTNTAPGRPTLRLKPRRRRRPSFPWADLIECFRNDVTPHRRSYGSIGKGDK